MSAKGGSGDAGGCGGLGGGLSGVGWCVCGLECLCSGVSLVNPRKSMCIAVVVPCAGRGMSRSLSARVGRMDDVTWKGCWMCQNLGCCKKVLFLLVGSKKQMLIEAQMRLRFLGLGGLEGVCWSLRRHVFTGRCVSGASDGKLFETYTVLCTNVDYAELMWEEFVQAIQTFLADKANLDIATQKGKKTKPHVIPYCQFTKLIICYLGRTHNIYQRSMSPFHLTKEDHRHENLKFVPKGEVDEVFGMQIPKELITDNIRNAPYYNGYLEMVAKHDRKIAAEEGGKKNLAAKVDQSKKPATSKKLKTVPSKQSKPAPTKQPKPMQEKSTKPSPVKKAAKDGQAPVGGVGFRKPASGITQKLPIVEVTKEAPTGPPTQPKDDTSANIIYDTSSPTYAETGAETDKMNSEGDTEILNIGHGGSDPGKTPESRPPSERVLLEEDQARPNPGQSHMALVRSDPEPMHDDFVATVYPQVHESLKHPYKEHVHVENPLSSTGTLSSMKNLEAFTLGDQFLNDKSTEEDSRKTNMETKVESMVTVLIHQASSSVPPLYTLVIDLTPLKPMDEFLEATAKSRKRHHDNQDPPPPPLDSDQKAPSSSSKQMLVPQSEQPVKDVPIADDVNISYSEDTSTAHLSSIKTKAAWFKPVDSLAKSYKDPEENKLLSKTGDMGSCSKWYCKWIRKKKLTKADLEGIAYMTVKPFHTNNISLQFQMEECHWLLTDKIDLMNPEGHWVMPNVSKPLPLGGPPGDNERRSALLISKLKVTHYLDFGLEELVPSLWIKSEHDYDISAAYGITHWWFKRKEFYIQRHSVPSNRRAVQSQMRILNVTCLKTYERYGYTYLREIVLHKADYNEYKISKADFKNLHLNDFEDLYLLHP
ncbi:hypothetical protein Tco_0740727 [Tanacetum coccineum]